MWRKKRGCSSTCGETIYKSPRIRHLYRKSKELGIPFYILSAKYGLVNADTVIEPYDKIMTTERALELLPQVKETIKEFDVVIFYRSGARREYRYLVERACRETGTRLISFGYGNMGDIRKLENFNRGDLRCRRLFLNI
ncbi:DUF6884 domain-containing protein [Thermococcus stetteri]|uniref:DUF6884 domain-containing protein n=1 Tax=Thermococcus stetteri TaxID=49900 RepID=UPI001AE44484|nr:DUF6884 domain-containing protein [Thermococcus stetteri]MBP1912546.1 hypothetical protein [Thermococcus stetteri]